MIYDPVTLVQDVGKNRITPASSFLPWKSAAQSWDAASLNDAQALLEQSGYRGEPFLLSYKRTKIQMWQCGCNSVHAKLD